MSEVELACFPEMPADEAIEHVCASIQLCAAAPNTEAAATGTVARLTASFGPIVQKIIALIGSGLTSLPAILAALTAAGVTLPPWASIIVTLLLALTPKPAPTPAPAA